MNLLAHNYFTRGFWGDESWTALISQFNLGEIIRVTSEDYHPPFYYFIVHFWGNAFGFGETAIRLISLIFFLLTPVTVFFLTNKFFKNLTKSLTASLLVLLSPILVTYAFEARSYALLAFLSVASGLAFWQSRTEKGYFWRVLYLFFGAMSVYTHYYAWFILASHGLYLLIFERRYFKKLLPFAVGILAIQLPWIPKLLSQVGAVDQSYWIAPINYRTHWEFFLRVAGGDYTTVFQHPASYLIIFLTLFGLFTKTTKKDYRFSPEIKFLLCWIIIPTLLPTIISVKTPIFFYRYLIFSAIPLLILAVHGLFKLQKPLPLLSLSLLLGLYALVDFNSFARYPDSMRETVEQVYQSKTPGDGPVYTVLPAFAEVMYYAGPTDQILVSPEGLVQFSGKSLLDAFVRRGRVEIVSPPDRQSYWFLEPGPKATYITPGILPK